MKTMIVIAAALASMRTALVLFGLSLFCAAAEAQGDDYRALNDCMAGDFQTSIQACTRLIERGGLSAAHAANLYTLRGSAHMEAGNNDKAIADLNKAIELAPQSYGTYYLRSVFYYAYRARNQRDPAQADFKHRAQADMKLSMALFEATKHHDSRDAIQDYCVGALDRAIKADPRLAAAYVKSGMAIRHEADKRIADLHKAIELDPEYSAAYVTRGQVYELGLRDFQKAMPDYEKAIVLNPQYSAAYAGRGRIYEQTNHLDKAIADFDKAIELDPRHYPAHRWRALAAEKKGDKAGAIASHRKALEINPYLSDSKAALKRLGAEP